MGHLGKLQYLTWSNVNSQWQWVTEWEEPKDDCSYYRVCGPFGVCTENNDSLCSCLPGFEPISPNDPKNGCKRTSEICDKKPSIETPSEKPKNERKSSSSKRVLAISIVVSALVLPLFCGVSYISYKRLMNRRNNNQNNIELPSRNTRAHIIDLLSLDHSKEDHREGLDVPYFELESLMAATDDFSEENRLGQGGFGPVYKDTMDPKTVVWVANRDTPVLDSTGVFTVAEDGNFKVLNKDQNVYFETNYTVMNFPTLWCCRRSSSNSVEVIGLMNVASGSILWQSFETPTDTFLPEMIMDTNMKLTSWKSITDPGSGSFEFQPESGTTRYSILNGSTKFLWKSGKISDSFDENQIFSKAFDLLSNTIIKRRKIILRNGTRSSEPYMAVDPNSRLVMGHSGKLQYLTWSEVKNQWVSEWEEPKDVCFLAHHLCCVDCMLDVLAFHSVCTLHLSLKKKSLRDDHLSPKCIKDPLVKLLHYPTFELESVIAATNNFSEENRLGHGGFGPVYKYALNGLLSIKSDVFSFGVVLLEIAWSLWIEDRPFEILDQILMKSCNSSEVLKCVIVGLLCVQGDPDDRPTMTNVVMMLGGVAATALVMAEAIRRRQRRDNYSCCG
ncbi:hypothetical protein L1987_32038 [Smallanthus sonchifolius]|uniref:Uncharacterized protein n=1 Tax=Smallanthus sonchifolius TaxID=185202 RepID=A0ACB9I6M1_9ASTR|nr:hypothetical protein L1987_32038 [Smallanthus sonchifolius]